MKYFCSKCGKTTQYNFELPKFCAFCGQSFANQSASQNTIEKGNKFLNELKLKKNTNHFVIEEDVKDIELENYHLEGHLKTIKPSFKIDIYQSKGESFGSLIDNPIEPLEKQLHEEPLKQKSTEQILEDFKKESASIRNYE